MVVALQLLLNTLRLSAAGGPAAHAGHWTSPPCAGSSSKSLQGSCVGANGRIWFDQHY